MWTPMLLNVFGKIQHILGQNWAITL
jgi:hypothetical protein